MDRIDKKILAELQLDGRLSVTELAERVGLSVSPCHRRLKALEESGAILNYKVKLASDIVGLGFSALVFVTMKDGDNHALDIFEKQVADIPNVTQAQRLFGDPDYLLHVVASDLPSFQQLYDLQLSALPHVRRLSSTIVMKNVVSDRPLPL